MWRSNKLNLFKDNPRHLLGVALIVLILWLYGLLNLRDSLQAEIVSYNQIVRKIRHAQATAAQKDWLQREVQARNMLFAMQSHLWHADTPGLAQANLNDWLGQAAQQSGIQNMQVVVASPELKQGKPLDKTGMDAEKNVWRVSSRLVSEFNPKTYYSLLEKIALNEKYLKVESLTIHTLPAPRAELMLAAYFVPAAADSSAKEARKN